MKLNFTKKEIKNIKNIIDSYESVNKMLSSLQNQSQKIQEKVDGCIKKLDDLKEKEKSILVELKKKYGNFSLQDISDTIYE